MMRNTTMIAATTAAAVIGSGLAFGSASRNHPPLTPSDSAPIPSPTPASLIEQRLQMECERSASHIRLEHPDAYVADCNYGQGTLTIP
jgi:hypothetical protein